MSKPHPRSLAHVGLTVPDIDRAVDWYESVLGFECFMGPETVDGDEETQIGELCRNVLGEFESLKVAHLSTGNGVAVELFEFSDGESFEAPDPKQPGYFHLCVIDPDIEGLAAEIEATGGEHHTEIWELFPGQEYRMTYCKDPFGNLVEIYTHSHERIYSNQGVY